jgi:hypothetical protein
VQVPEISERHLHLRLVADPVFRKKLIALAKSFPSADVAKRYRFPLSALDLAALADYVDPITHPVRAIP